MEFTKNQLEAMQESLKIQGDDGNWNYDSYMHGMYNGMELMLAYAENREPKFREAPTGWVCDNKQDSPPVSMSAKEAAHED